MCLFQHPTPSSRPPPKKKVIWGSLTIWMFPKIVGFPPNHPILIGFSIIFTMQFWGKTHYFRKHPNFAASGCPVFFFAASKDAGIEPTVKDPWIPRGPVDLSESASRGFVCRKKIKMLSTIPFASWKKDLQPRHIKTIWEKVVEFVWFNWFKNWEWYSPHHLWDCSTLSTDLYSEHLIGLNDHPFPKDPRMAYSPTFGWFLW